MPKVVSIAALIAAAGAICVAPGSGAEAAPSATIRTLHPVMYTTRYRDVAVTHRVMQIRRIVTVTRIQPILQVHWVTRVRHRTIDEPAAPMREAQRSVLGASYQCGCGS